GRRLRAAHKHEQLAIRRPTRRAVMQPICQPPRSLIAARRDRPDRCVIASLLLIHTDLDENHLRSIGRNLRIADPVELEEVLLGDRTLLSKCRARECDQTEQYMDCTKAREHVGSNQENWQLKQI